MAMDACFMLVRDISRFNVNQQQDQQQQEQKKRCAVTVVATCGDECYGSALGLLNASHVVGGATFRQADAVCEAIPVWPGDVSPNLETEAPPIPIPQAEKLNSATATASSPIVVRAFVTEAFGRLLWTMRFDLTRAQVHSVEIAAERAVGELAANVVTATRQGDEIAAAASMQAHAKAERELTAIRRVRESLAVANIGEQPHAASVARPGERNAASCEATSEVIAGMFHQQLLPELSVRSYAVAVRGVGIQNLRLVSGSLSEHRDLGTS